MDGPEALPRSNGELVFSAPWEGRVFGLALALVRAHGLAWDEFRTRLIAAIAAEPSRPYFESWTAALEALWSPVRGERQAAALAEAGAHASPIKK